MLDFRDKSHMGHQNKAHVTIKCKECHEPLSTSLALQEHMGRCTHDVPE